VPLFTTEFLGIPVGQHPTTTSTWTGYGEPERLAPFCILVRYNYPTVDGFFKMVAVGKKLLKK